MLAIIVWAASTESNIAFVLKVSLQQVLNKLAEFHDRYNDFSKDPFIPQSMSRAISKLVTCVGNIEVRASASKCHPMVKYVVEEVLKWQRRSGRE